MNIYRGISAVALLLATSACVGSYDDVSNDARFAQYLGSVYVSTVDLNAIGVTLDQNYRTGIDVIHLYPFGISGPEVKGRGIVKAGAQVKVKAVKQLRFTRFWAGDYAFVLEGAQCSICSQAEVLVDVREGEDGRLVMPDYFSGSAPPTSSSLP